jgi:hypothetical protein
VRTHSADTQAARVPVTEPELGHKALCIGSLSLPIGNSYDPNGRSITSRESDEKSFSHLTNLQICPIAKAKKHLIRQARDDGVCN